MQIEEESQVQEYISTELDKQINASEPRSLRP